MSWKKRFATMSTIYALNAGASFPVQAQEKISDSRQKEHVQHAKNDILITLESEAFENPKDTALFRERLSFNSFITPIFVDSATFDEHKKSSLVPSKDSTTYLLYLPIDMKIKDIPNIVRQINTMTFGTNIPAYASYQEIKKHLVSVMNYLNRHIQQGKKIEEALKTYQELYEAYFPNEPLSEGSEGDKKDKMKLDAIQQDTLVNVENILAQNFYEHMFEAAFEEGSVLMGNIDHIKKRIPLVTYKKQLNQSEKTKNKELLVKTQKEILNEVLRKIHTSPYFKNEKGMQMAVDVFNQSIPSQITKTNEIQCVGFSILLHQILADLNIKHFGLTQDGHSSILVQFANDEYRIADAKNNEKLTPRITIRKNGARQKIQIDKDTINVLYDNPEQILMGQIMINKALTIINIESIDSKEKKEAYILKALEFEPKNTIYMRAIITLYLEMKRYDDALKYANKAIEYEPEGELNRFVKEKILLLTNRVDEYRKNQKEYEKMKKGNR